MLRHMEKEEDANRSNLIQIGVSKLTSRNATKRLKIWQQTRISKNAKATLK